MEPRRSARTRTGYVILPVTQKREILVRGADVRKGGTIYGLVDPRDPQRVRYVGQTIEAPATRYRGHIQSALPKKRVSRTDQCARAVWIRALVAEGVYPDMVLLERVPNAADLTEQERLWIDTFRMEKQADLNAPLPSHWSLRERVG